MAQDLLRLSTAGSVDDGKSTLIGRLLYDSGTVYEDQLNAVRRASQRGLELAFLTDGLRAEREQGITIDVAYRYFSTRRRKFIIADTPGHEQYTRNMATGASTAQLALVLMDARKGILRQTIRHVAIAWLLGIRHIVVAVNKMDLVDLREEVFERSRRDFEPLQNIMQGTHLYFVPIVALDGDNVVHRSQRMPWFTGPSILEYLDTVPIEDGVSDQPFRMPVQHVIRQDGFRSYAGQIVSGSIALHQELLALPSGRRVQVASLPSFDGDLTAAHAPMSVSVCLDDHVDLGRGDMLVDVARPPKSARSIRARVVWMSEVPLLMGRRYLIKHASQTVWCEVGSAISTLDLSSLTEHPAKELQMNDIGLVTIRLRRPIYCDSYSANRHTGSFIVIDPITNLTLGAGTVESVLEEQTTNADSFPAEGMTVWFTGLSSAGKSTLSRAVYDRLWERGYRVEHLDGDEVRRHLSRGLGFSREDRNENVRRIGFVAGMLARHGVIALVSAIAPYREGRDELRARIPGFVEVYVNAPLSVCEERDVKGLYRQARRGEIAHFTGIDDPYEPPLSPEVECRTDLDSVDQCADKVVAAIERRLYPAQLDPDA
ncbi:MAG TPA: adenylyl-sulfate kinase [Acidobacteriaceae bacterium]|jgi:bifunctional enzyme CysN/CysC|nr:adenylyl-sulfate kinase [Acidobacteriaceae bacterium]